MIDRTVFLVSGFSRGGTNLLWNLICSHPQVLSTGLELNEILGPSRTNIPLHWKAAIEVFSIPDLPAPQHISDYAGARLVSFAKENGKGLWGKWKTENVIYTEDEILQLPICTKSVNSWARDWLFALCKRNIALKYNGLLLKSFGSMRTIYLIRDCESQCNGWMRRGCKPYEAGKWYRRIVELMLKDYKLRPDDILFVSFDDIIKNSISTIVKIYDFLDLDEIDITTFHLKAKKIINSDGEHKVTHGVEGDMLWVPKDQLDRFIDSEVDARQRNMLGKKERNDLYKGLGGISERIESLFNGAGNLRV